MKNPFYKGLIKYNGEYFKGKHTPIISDELWALANQRIKEKLPGHQFIPRQKEYAYLLSGLLKCGYCGSHYIATSCVSHGTRHYYYNCGRAKQKIGCDNTKSIKARQLDAALLEYFKRASQDRTLIAKAIGKALIEAKEHYDEADRAYADSAAKLAQLQAEGQRMLDLAVNGDIQRGPSYKAKLAKLETAITEQEKEAEKLKQTRDEHGMMAYAGEHITENIEYALANFDKAQPETQRNLLRALIKDIRLFDDKAEISLYLIDGKLTNTPEQGTEPQTGKNTGSEGQENNGKKGKKITPRIDGGLNNSETMFVSRQMWLPGQDSNLQPIG
ncbi:MAG: hypothetical protein GX410_04940 [Elusimicrobia bacterium]|nr:hypothetical protein [Elusimicrobiota bacterium]